MIFQTRIYKDLGFTLVEVLIALVIIAVVVSIGAPKLLKTFGSPTKKITRNIVVLAKQLHNTAKLKNKTYRIVIQFPDTEKKLAGQFYVESGSNDFLIEIEKDRKYKSSWQKKEEDKNSPFSPDPSIMKKAIALPKGVEFLSVETENTESPITDGKAYIHFFKQGLIERSVIQLLNTSNKTITSLIINPLTGRTDVEEGPIKLGDITP